MGKTQTDKRTRLVETAMKLAYRDGFRESRLADIDKAAHVHVGNVYYYFKTKEELGGAVVERRLEEVRAFRGGNGQVEFSKGAAVCFRGQHSTQEGAVCASRMSTW